MDASARGLRCLPVMRLRSWTLATVIAVAGCGARSELRLPDGAEAPDDPDGAPPCRAGDGCNPPDEVRDGVCGAPRVVLDDGFERATTAFGIAAGAVVSCWTVARTDVDVLSDGQGFIGRPHSGLFALDLNGWTSGAIARTVRTRRGRRYVLSFAMTRNPGIGGAPATGELWIDGALVQTLAAPWSNSYPDLRWQQVTAALTAARAETRIELRSTNPGNGGLYLDTFTMTEVTP